MKRYCIQVEEVYILTYYINASNPSEFRSGKFDFSEYQEKFTECVGHNILSIDEEVEE